MSGRTRQSRCLKYRARPIRTNIRFGQSRQMLQNVWMFQAALWATAYNSRCITVSRQTIKGGRSHESGRKKISSNGLPICPSRSQFLQSEHFRYINESHSCTAPVGSDRTERSGIDGSACPEPIGSSGGAAGSREQEHARYAIESSVLGSNRGPHCCDARIGDPGVRRKVCGQKCRF